MYKAGLCILIAAMIMPVYALEDCIITSDTKMTDIEVENPDVIEVHTLVTVMNEKNTLVVHPLKIGKTSFSVMKDGVRVNFKVNIDDYETEVESVNGYDVLPLDEPPEFVDCDIDRPPILRNEIDEEMIPPSLREGEE